MDLITEDDTREAVQAAGLRYLTDRKPGLRRERDGAGFRYLTAKGEAVTDERTLGRIRSLGIPPAYDDVWISPSPNSYLQATGRDAKGRKQYRYHPRWREVREETKFGRMLAFAQALPKIRARVDQDLALRGLPREKVLATVVRLLETTLIRVGNEEYAKTNGHYGLTTLQNEHVEVDGSTVQFHFVGKSGKEHTISLRDRRLARIVARCQSLPDQELFEYLDEDGARHTVGSGDVNDYLRETAGEDFTAKDFRTWAGTVLACAALGALEPFETASQARKNVSQAIKAVAARLGNTAAICRKHYVHPAVLEQYEAATLTVMLSGSLPDDLESVCADLRAEEQAVIRLLCAHQAS